MPSRCTVVAAVCWRLRLRLRGDAWRVVYAIQIGTDLWVLHAFQKKSKSGIATPAHEIELARDRLKRLKEMLNER